VLLERAADAMDAPLASGLAAAQNAYHGGCRAETGGS